MVMMMSHDLQWPPSRPKWSPTPSSKSNAGQPHHPLLLLFIKRAQVSSLICDEANWRVRSPVSPRPRRHDWRSSRSTFACMLAGADVHEIGQK
jgi:hypothetical protein